MTTKIKFLSATCSLFLFAACNGNVDFGEQYKKTLFIVNGPNYVGDHFFEATNNNIVISVYCASSEPIKKDVKVRLMIDPYVLDSLNSLNTAINSEYIARLMLPETNYTWSESPYVTIKAGTQYGTFDIPFDEKGLDPDKYYALPMCLSANSAGYEVNQQLKVILYEIRLVNDFSGEFAGSSVEVPASEDIRPVVRTIQTNLKAMSKTSVRLPIHDAEADDMNNQMILTISDNGSVSISPWKNAVVNDLGGSKYNRLTMQFELNYSYKGKVISETLTNILAPKTDDN